MKSVREAIDLVVGGVATLPGERADLRSALDRVLAEEVYSPLDLPAWPNSAMDGYAARSADVRGATPLAPRRLRVVEELPAGAFPTRPVGSGEATRIMTGAPLPGGADSVVRQEDTRPEDGVVLVLSDRDAGRNVRRAGEDIRKGSLVLAAGSVLGPAQIGVLASIARAEVAVHRAPRVGILATGDEIVDLDRAAEILAGRKTATSNSYTLDALVRRNGGLPVHLGIAADTRESLRERFERGTREADLIVSTAGISVGEYDYVRQALDDLGCELAFWKVRMRPGSPLAFGVVRGVPWIGLPGNPVSTMVCFELVVRPAIRKMAGHAALHRRTIPVRLEEPVRVAGRLTHFLRAVVRESGAGYVARLTGPQGSGILTSMAAANALLVVPEDRGEVAAGEALAAIWLEDGALSTLEPPVG